MPELLHCPGCNRLIRVDDSLRGRQVQCPGCQEIFRVGNGSEAITSKLPTPAAHGPTAERYTAQPLPIPPRPRPSRIAEDWQDMAPSPPDSDFGRRRLPAALSGGGLATSACIGFALLIIVHVIMVVQNLSTLELLRRAPFVNDSEADAHDSRAAALAMGNLLILIPLVIVFCMWIYRAYANLLLFGQRDLRFTPGWAVGYWFIPLVNLVRPVQVVQEIWRASSPTTSPEDPQAWTREPGSVRVGFWWLFYLSCGIIGSIGAAMERQAARTQSIPGLEDATRWLMIGNALSIVALVLAISVVVGIHARQKHKLHQFRAEADDWNP